MEGQIGFIIISADLMAREKLAPALVLAGLRFLGRASRADDIERLLRETKPGLAVCDMVTSPALGSQVLDMAGKANMPPIFVICSDRAQVLEGIRAGVVGFIIDEQRDTFEREYVAAIKTACLAAANKMETAPAVKEEFAGSRIKKMINEAVALPPMGVQLFKGILAIGASTGGTESTTLILKTMPRDIPPTVVVQHMPPVFTRMYAENLNSSCQMNVREAKDGDMLEPGLVLIAPGDRQLHVVKKGSGYQVSCRGSEKVSGHCPSVDVLFSSVASAAKADAVGVILTGMGADGARGLLEMRNAGAYTIGQDEKTSIVYGMPKEAYRMGGVRKQLALGDISAELIRYFKTMRN